MYVKIFVCVYTLISVALLAQPVVIEGKITGAEGRTIVLLGYNGAENFPIDSTVVVTEKSYFRLTAEIPYQGLFKLMVEKGQGRNQDRYIDLILSNGSEIQFSTVFPYLTDSLKVHKGRELSYFHEFTRSYNGIQYKIILLAELLQRYPAEDSFYKVAEQKIRKLSQEKAELFKRFRDTAFPLANRYISMLRQWDAKGDDFSGSFYRGIDLSDTLWTRNVLLHQKIGQYYSYLANNQSFQDFHTMNKNFIDSVLNPLKVNEVLWKNIFAYLVRAFKAMNYPEGLEYLKVKYMEGDVCTDGANLPEIDEILANLEVLKPGAPLPEGMVQTLEGKELLVPAELPVSGLKLMIFWSHKCRHCNESKPYWEDLYKRKSPKGLKVVTLHNGDARQEWLRAIEDLPKEWIHLHDPLGWNGYTGRLKITGTPAYILLDAENRILKKTFDLMEIESILNNVL